MFARILLLYFFVTTSVWAAKDYLGQAIPSDIYKGEMEFLAPNEINPALALPVFKQAPAGMYITVGTERGFLSAASSPAITHLLIIDSNPLITYYNLINRSLLKISSDRKDYLNLRLKANLDEWNRRMSQLGSDDLILTSKEFNWWRDYVRGELPGEEGWFTLFHTDFHAMKSRLSYAPFKGVNYLYDDKLFKKISSMAKANMISVLIGNLTDPKLITGIMKKMKADRVLLSIFDWSNAWWPKFTPRKDLTETMVKYLTLAHPHGLMLMTHESQVADGGVDYRTLPLSEVTSSDDLTETIEKSFLSPFTLPSKKRLNCAELLFLIKG